jgi:hypothetical protein
METPYAGRAIINDLYNGVEIIVPAKKNWFLIVFLSLWLCFWVVGEFAVPTGVFSEAGKGAPEPFMIIWTCAWTIGGIFVISTLWWNFAGKEIITLSAGVLTIAKKGAIAKTKSYDLNQATNFRAVQDYIETSPFGRRRSGPSWIVANQGTIKFDYGMETVKFGDQLYQAEGDYILQRLRGKRLIS